MELPESLSYTFRASGLVELAGVKIDVMVMIGARLTVTFLVSGFMIRNPF